MVDADTLREEFKGIDVELDEDNDAELLQACVDLCEQLGLEAHEIATKWDAYAYGNKIELNAFNLTTLKKLERSIREGIAREQKNQQKIEKRVTHTTGAPVSLNKYSLGSSLGASFSKTFGVQVDEPALHSQLTPEKGEKKMKRELSQEDEQMNTPAVKRVKLDGSPGVVSIMASPASPGASSQGSYASRKNKGDVLTNLNAELSAAHAAPETSDVGLSGSYVGGRVQCEDLSSILWRDVRSDGEVIPFRYMFEDEQEE
eukprot:gb/GEZN01016560.1/.p1 GENE.gb/GEZN01016560.1/~~gb/GEZN01016560.1/.p1  ORF type:complete len:259 (-),score=45.35 gb/GEZN01016560.1/:46-822(-)